MSVGTDISASQDLLGKVIADLQSGITVGNGEIKGTLNNVTGYTGFSGDVSEQSGHYLALHCAVPNVSGAEIKAQLIGGYHGEVTLDPDGIIIFRIASNTQKVKITATKTGYAPYIQTYSLANLTLAS